MRACVRHDGAITAKEGQIIRLQRRYLSLSRHQLVLASIHCESRDQLEQMAGRDREHSQKTHSLSLSGGGGGGGGGWTRHRGLLNPGCC